MQRAGKCEKIVVICALPTESKLGACSDAEACQNIQVARRGVYKLKPVHDVLKVRVRRKILIPRLVLRDYALLTKE